MRVRLFPSLVTVLLCCFCPACSTLVQKPTAELRSAAVKNVTAEGIAVDFAMDVANPNPVTVPLSGAQYKLALGGVKVLDDSVKTTGDVPAKGTLPVTLPVTLSFNSLMAAEEAIKASKGEVPYTLDGGLDFVGPSAIGGIPIHIPLKFSGTLSLRKALSDPVALMKNPAARKLAEQTLGGLFSH